MTINLTLFAEDAYPASLPVTYIDHPGDLEIEACNNFFRGKTIREIDAVSLLSAYHHKFDLPAIVNWMSSPALVFFLPGLIGAVYSGSARDSTQLPELGERIALHLLEYAEGQHQDEFQLLKQTYTNLQLAEFAKFLIYMRDMNQLRWSMEIEFLLAADPDATLSDAIYRELACTTFSPWDPAARALEIYWKNFLPES